MNKLTIIIIGLVLIPFVSAQSIDTSIQVYLDGYAKISHIINLDSLEDKIIIPVYAPESISTSVKYDDSNKNKLILFPSNNKVIDLVYLTKTLTKKDKEWKFSYVPYENEKVEVSMPISSKVLSKTFGYIASQDNTGKVFEWVDSNNIEIEYEYEFTKDETKIISDFIAIILIFILTIGVISSGFVLYRDKKISFSKDKELERIKKLSQKQDREIEYLRKTKSHPIQSFLNYYNLLGDNDKEVVKHVFQSPHLRISKKTLRKNLANSKEKDNKAWVDKKVKLQQAVAQQVSRSLKKLVKPKSDEAKNVFKLFTIEDDIIEFSAEANEQFKLKDKEILDKIKIKLKINGERK